MSVVVKGLKLENKHLDGYVDVRIHYRDGAIYATIPIGERPYYKRLEVVELPDKHGRLVDAGECAEYFWEHLDDNGMAGAMNAINDMSTIVEAEGEP